jgi:uncharacterized coiled-coil DUF342 family protein
MVCYKCKDCNYETFKKSSFVSHFKRKNPCNLKREFSIDEMKIADEFAEKFKRRNEENLSKMQTLNEIENKIEERNKELQSIKEQIKEYIVTREETQEEIKKLKEMFHELEQKRLAEIDKRLRLQGEQTKEKITQLEQIKKKPKPQWIFA